MILVVVATMFEADALSSSEQELVGRWFTTHGNLETSIELRADRSVTVAQTARVALAPDLVKVFGPTITSGRWRLDGSGHLCLATSSPSLRDTAWGKLGRFVRTQRWPARGELHRAWRIELLTSDRLGFVDLGTGVRGRAIKSPSLHARGSADGPVRYR